MQLQSVGRLFLYVYTRKLHQVVGALCGWSTHAALSERGNSVTRCGDLGRTPMSSNRHLGCMKVHPRNN